MRVFERGAFFPVFLAGCFFFSISAGAASSVVPFPAEEARKSLVPHQAIYDIKMSSVKIGSQVLDVRGKMYYSLKESCAGWITDHRFTMVYEYSDAPAIQIDTHFASFETYNGTVLDFSSSRSRDGEIYDSVRGKARLGADDPKENIARYSLPEEIKYDLTTSTLFPMAHTYRLIEAAERGQKVLAAVVFDGSDDQGPVEINAVIGKKRPAKPSSLPFIDKELTNSPSWPVRLAIFPLDSDEFLADYEMSMDVLENGIVRDMNVDYHDFSISQKLVALKEAPSDECKN